MKPLVVVPFHDPKWLRNTEGNLARQSVEARVLLVVNGKATGWTSDRWQTTPSGNSHADAVNAGVEWARDGRDFSHVVLFDSDDYYGPRYLEHQIEALKKADFCGKQRVFTQLQSGEVHLFERPGRPFVFASVGFAINRFVPVLNTLENCQDWSARMREAGATSIDTGSADYCYRRHGENAHWDGRIGDLLVRASWGPSQFYGSAPVEVCNHPEGYVSSLKARPSDEEILASLS